MSPPAGGGHGDLFPIPLPSAKVGGSSLSSRAVRRRRTRLDGEEEQLRELISVLNDMDCRDWQKKVSRSSTYAQEAATRRLRASIQRVGPRPAGLDGAGALRALRKQGIYGEDMLVARFGAGEIHMPQQGSRPIPLSRLLGDGGPAVVREFLKTSRILFSTAQ